LNWENLRVGCLEEFINARMLLSAADLRDPEISELIGKKLREFHDLMDPRTSRCGRGSGMHFFMSPSIIIATNVSDC